MLNQYALLLDHLFVLLDKFIVLHEHRTMPHNHIRMHINHVVLNSSLIRNTLWDSPIRTIEIFLLGLGHDLLVGRYQVMLCLYILIELLQLSIQAGGQLCSWYWVFTRVWDG